MGPCNSFCFVRYSLKHLENCCFQAKRCSQRLISEICWVTVHVMFLLYSTHLFRTYGRYLMLEECPKSDFWFWHLVPLTSGTKYFVPLCEFVPLVFFRAFCFFRRSGVPLGVLSCAKISYHSDLNPSNAIQYQFLVCGQHFGVMFLFSEIFFSQYRCPIGSSLVCQNIIKVWPKPIKCQSIQNCGVWTAPLTWLDLCWLDLSCLDLTCLDLTWLR